VSYKIIAVLGASTAQGFWDETGAGWFGRLATKISAEHPFQYGFCNCSVDGDSVADSFHRLNAEVISREPDILIIETGSNDLTRSPDKDSPAALSGYFSTEYWHRLLECAKKNIPNVIVLDVRPRRNDTASFTGGWSNAVMYKPNSDIAEYNKLLEDVCKKHDVPFIRRFDKWIARDLSKLHHDNSHPNGAGHQLIADEVYEELIKLGVI